MPNLIGAKKFSFRSCKGELEMELPENDGSCRGTYEYTAKGKGVWAVACTNGLAGSGELKTYGKGKGSSGTGKDSNGRNIKFTVGVETVQ